VQRSETPGFAALRGLHGLIWTVLPTPQPISLSFNGRMRDEGLNETLFFDLDDARTKIAVLLADDNERRPHSSLAYLTPTACAANRTATDDRLRHNTHNPPGL